MVCINLAFGSAMTPYRFFAGSCLIGVLPTGASSFTLIMLMRLSLLDYLFALSCPFGSIWYSLVLSAPKLHLVERGRKEDH